MVMTSPYGSQDTVYANFAGEVMLTVHHDVASGLSWETFNKFDGSGRLILTASPSAVTGYDETKADLLNYTNGSYQYLSNNSGLIAITDYYATTTATSSTAGGVAGYFEDTKIEEGQAGTPVLQHPVQYY